MAKGKKYNIVSDAEIIEPVISAGDLKEILKDVPADAFICFNDGGQKLDIDLFGNVNVKGHIKQNYSLGGRKKITKIVFTPFSVNKGENNDKE